ncbi:MAG: CPBP family glutamic-type intramembrane protease [Candidatus Acidiferrum sp.]
MSLFEEYSPLPPDQEPPAPSPADRNPGSDQPTPPPAELPLAGDPISFAASAQPESPAYSRQPPLPEDLRISWSWPHLVLFLFFGFTSLLLIQAGFAIYYAPLRHFVNEKDFERFVLSKPQFAIGSMLLWYAIIFLFLYVTLAVLPGDPFWRTLGWRKIMRRKSGSRRSPWLFLLAGSGLSILVSLSTLRMQPPENVPIEELFRYKNTALLFMAMAVLVAPLVEETVFRGYLYPLLAKSFGVASGVIITGILFGLMHGAQLGWTWGLVLVLIVVGVVFTFVRARTGSVFASFLLHLGYNSTIALITILSTRGFTRIPSLH